MAGKFTQAAHFWLACAQTSPISFVVPRATKEIGDVCTQANLWREMTQIEFRVKRWQKMYENIKLH